MRCTILALVVVLLATPQLTHAKGGGGGGGGRSAASGAGFSAASSGGRGSTYSFRRRASVGHRQNYGYGRGGASYPPAYSSSMSSRANSRMMMAGLGFIIVTSRRRWSGARRRHPRDATHDSSWAVDSDTYVPSDSPAWVGTTGCKVTLYEHGFNGYTTDRGASWRMPAPSSAVHGMPPAPLGSWPERKGLPKVVALEGAAQDEMQSEYGQKTQEVPHDAGRSWSTTVTGQWVSPPPGDALLGQASALSIQGNCALIVSPFIDGVAPSGAGAGAAGNATFPHVWHGPGTWSCGLERDASSNQLQTQGYLSNGLRSANSNQDGEHGYHTAYKDCGLCLATGNDNIYAVRLEHLSNLTGSKAVREAALQACQTRPAQDQLSEIIATPSTRRRRSAAVAYCPCENDSCGPSEGADWAGAVTGIFTVLAIVVVAVLWRNSLKKRQQRQQQQQMQQRHWAHPTPAYPQQPMQVQQGQVMQQPQMTWPPQQQQQMQQMQQMQMQQMQMQQQQVPMGAGAGVQPVMVVQGQVMQAGQPGQPMQMVVQPQQYGKQTL